MPTYSSKDQRESKVSDLETGERKSNGNYEPIPTGLVRHPFCKFH